MNNSLRNNIHKRALKSNLIDLIGHAEMENEIQKTVTEIIRARIGLRLETPNAVELDELELKKYLDYVTKKKSKGNNRSFIIDSPTFGIASLTSIIV